MHYTMFFFYYLNRTFSVLGSKSWENNSKVVIELFIKSEFLNLLVSKCGLLRAYRDDEKLTEAH